MRGTLLLLAAALPGFACSCVSYEKVSACEVFHKARVIFRGRVIDHNHDSRLGFGQWTLYRFQVEEVFKGLSPNTKEVFIDPASFTGCYGGFDSHADYLIYTGSAVAAETYATFYSRVKDIKSRDGSVKFPLPAWNDRGGLLIFLVGECSPSRTVQSDDPDLTYLRLAAQGKIDATGSISGVAVQNGKDSALLKDLTPAADAKITVRKGNESWSSTTAADGSYSFPKLPPGKYRLAIESPALGTGDFLHLDPEVEVVPGGCVVARASFGTSATISGTVLNHEGRAAPGVRIDLGTVGTDGTVRVVPITWTHTDQRGEFTVRNVPAAPVVLGANLRSSPTLDEPYDSVYAPAASNVADARIFSLEANEQVTGVILRLPKPLPIAKLFVDVVWPDGSAATGGARAFAKWNKLDSGFERAPFDSNRVALPLALGRTYEISADWLSDRQRQFVVIAGEKSQSVAFSQDGQSLTIRLKQPRPPDH